MPDVRHAHFPCPALCAADARDLVTEALEPCSLELSVRWPFAASGKKATQPHTDRLLFVSCLRTPAGRGSGSCAVAQRNHLLSLLGDTSVCASSTARGRGAERHHRVAVRPDPLGSIPVQPERGLEPGYERRVRAGDRDEQPIVQRQPGEPAPRTDADPALPPLGGKQFCSGLVQSLSVVFTIEAATTPIANHGSTLRASETNRETPVRARARAHPRIAAASPGLVSSGGLLSSGPAGCRCSSALQPHLKHYRIVCISLRRRGGPDCRVTTRSSAPGLVTVGWACGGSLARAVAAARPPRTSRRRRARSPPRTSAVRPDRGNAR
jgi:hypothetical protein